MKTTKLMAFTALFASAALTSCIDDKYDLSDVDTTVQVSVKELILPVNIDEIYMTSIIKETDDIKIINGVYTYLTNGTFSSEPIKIPGVKVGVDKINDVTFKVFAPTVPVAGIPVTYQLGEVEPADFSFAAKDVTPDLQSLARIYGNTAIKLELSLAPLKNLTDNVELQNVTFELPKHLHVADNSYGTYNSATGEFKLNTAEASTSKPFAIALAVTGLDVEAGEFDGAKHALDITGQIGIKSCEIHFVTKAGGELSLGTYETLSLACSIDPIELTAFDGILQHTIDPIKEHIALNNLPDFLNRPGTDLRLANPCLYLSTNNPLEGDNLYLQTGFELLANRKGQTPKTYKINNPYFTIAKDQQSVNGKYNFCLAPNPQPNEQYPNAKGVAFSSLGDILAGDGLPASLDVVLTDPQVPSQAVTKFDIGRTYPKVEGKYTFLAPFNLKAGSQIFYADTLSGWSSEDLDELTIQKLEVNLNVTTDIPISAILTGYPVDKNLKQINGVKIESTKIPANAKAAPVTIRITGEIKGLDGIIFDAIGTSDGGDLSADGHITLTNVRPKATGFYQKEL